MNPWTKARLVLALFVAGMLMPNAMACGYHLPQTILPYAVLMAWPATAGSLFLSAPLCVWRERRARRTLLGMLRDGVCINDTKHVMRRARVQCAILVIALGAAGPYLFGWTMNVVGFASPEICGRILETHYRIAMLPEEIAERLMPQLVDGPPTDIIF